MATRARQIAKFMGKTETANSSNAALSTIDSSVVTTIVNASAIDSATVKDIPLTVFSSLDSLPSQNLEAGDKAYVTGNNRFYISNGSGWYNVALVNASPTLSISPSGAIALNTDGSTTTITLTGQDSDNANLTFSVESDGSFLGLGSIAQDSSVFTITPFSEDSATTTSSTLTFKVTDGINIASGTTAFSLSFTIANSQYTTMLIKADDAATDNQVDASTNTYSITENGNVTSSAFTPYHSGGYSIEFDGTDDRVVFDVGTTVGTADFTIECWALPQEAGDHGVFQMSDQTAGFKSSDYGNTLAIGRNSGSGWSIYGAGSAAYANTGALTTSKWVHFAYVRNSGTSKLYIDGTEQISQSDTTNYTARYCVIGTYYGASYTYKVAIKDFRIVIGSAVYTSNFTPPTSPLTAITNTKLLTCQDPYLEDNSTTAASPTITGNPRSVRISPYVVSQKYTKTDHGGSMYFDGTGDYATVGSASDGALTGTFTIELWFMLKEAYTEKVHTLVSNYDGGSDYWTVQIRNSGELWLAAAIGTTLSYTLNPVQNLWYHVAVSNDADNNTGKLFVNGRLVDSHSSAAIYDDADMAATSVPITIGRLGNNSTQDMYGYIADVRLLSGTHLRTAAFTPPTSPLSAISNTKLLTATNKNDVWCQANGEVLLKKTALPASDVQRKWTGSGVSSIRFSGDWIAQTMSAPLGSGDFTIEGWVYFDTNNDPHGVFQTGAATTTTTSFNYANANGCGLGLNASTGLWRIYHAGSATNASQQASATTWHHFAYVRHSGTIKLYIDGTATDISVSNTTDFTEPQMTFGAYYSSSYTMAGYLQDFRTTIGLARYTANFTAPTQAFDG